MPFLPRTLELSECLAGELTGIKESRFPPYVAINLCLGRIEINLYVCESLSKTSTDVCVPHTTGLLPLTSLSPL